MNNDYKRHCMSGGPPTIQDFRTFHTKRVTVAQRMDVNQPITSGSCFLLPHFRPKLFKILKNIDFKQLRPGRSTTQTITPGNFPSQGCPWRLKIYSSPRVKISIRHSFSETLFSKRRRRLQKAFKKVFRTILNFAPHLSTDLGLEQSYRFSQTAKPPSRSHFRS